MATEIDLGGYGIFPMGSTPVARYRAVKINSSGELVVAQGSAGPIMGIVKLDNAKAGQATNVQTQGIAKVESGATLAAGARVSTDANGKLKAVATGDYPLGVVLEAAVDGRIVKVDLYRSQTASA